LCGHRVGRPGRGWAHGAWGVGRKGFLQWRDDGRRGGGNDRKKREVKISKGRGQGGEERAAKYAVQTRPCSCGGPVWYSVHALQFRSILIHLQFPTAPSKSVVQALSDGHGAPRNCSSVLQNLSIKFCSQERRDASVRVPAPTACLPACLPACLAPAPRPPRLLSSVCPDLAHGFGPARGHISQISQNHCRNRAVVEATRF
jgi:hypothetical protein